MDSHTKFLIDEAFTDARKIMEERGFSYSPSVLVQTAQLIMSARIEEYLNILVEINRPDSPD